MRHRRGERARREDGDAEGAAPPLSTSELWYYRTLTRFAHQRDPTTRDELARYLARREFRQASSLGCWYLLLIPVPLLFVVRLGAWDALAVLVAAALLLEAADRLINVRSARRSLDRGTLEVIPKESVGPRGERVFQTYWRRPGAQNVAELDHPPSLYDAALAAEELWTWQMDVPRRTQTPKWLRVHTTLGMVKRLADGSPELVAIGECYYPYDPWSDRVVMD